MAIPDHAQYILYRLAVHQSLMAFILSCNLLKNSFSYHRKMMHFNLLHSLICIEYLRFETKFESNHKLVNVTFTRLVRYIPKRHQYSTRLIFHIQICFSILTIFESFCTAKIVVVCQDKTLSKIKCYSVTTISKMKLNCIFNYIARSCQSPHCNVTIISEIPERYINHLLITLQS